MYIPTYTIWIKNLGQYYYCDSKRSMHFLVNLLDDEHEIVVCKWNDNLAQYEELPNPLE